MDSEQGSNRATLIKQRRVSCQVSLAIVTLSQRLSRCRWLSDGLSFRARYNNSKIKVDIIGRYGVSQWFIEIISYDLAKDALSKHVSTSDVSHAGIREAVKKATQNLRWDHRNRSTCSQIFLQVLLLCGSIHMFWGCVWGTRQVQL